VEPTEGVPEGSVEVAEGSGGAEEEGLEDAGRWHMRETFKAADEYSNTCYESRAEAKAALIERQMELEEEGWRTKVSLPHGHVVMEWPEAWGGKDFDERNHIMVVRPCLGHGSEMWKPKVAGRYTEFRCRAAVSELDPSVVMDLAVVKATAKVRYGCGHSAVVELFEWSEAEARQAFVDLMSGRCPDCRRGAPPEL
jgi:hypothetical protein